MAAIYILRIHVFFFWCTIITFVSAQISFDSIEGTNTFCDTGPDAMTNSLGALTGGRPIPRYCITNPIDGRQERCYYLFVPECAKGPVPLMMDMHGGSSCPLWSVFFDGWLELAAKECFALFFPIGITDPAISDYPCFSVSGGRTVNGLFTTNDCCCTKGNKRLDAQDTKDVVVVQRMVKDMVFNERVQGQSNETASVDPTRIYLTGHSNGCLGSLAVGAYFSDMVASVCCHSSGAFSAFSPNYSPIPTWIAQGMKDDSIWFQFVKETYNTYGWIHECQNETSVGVDNGTAVEYTHYNCQNDANVTLLLLNESGHIPFANAFEISEGASVTTLDTTTMAWEFCSSFSKDSIPLILQSTSAGTRNLQWKHEFARSTILALVSMLVSA